MNKRGYLLLMGLLQALFITNVMAQELKTPTLEDLIPGGETYRYNFTGTGNQRGITVSYVVVAVVDDTVVREQLMR